MDPSEVFSKRIMIDGLIYPILFTFRMMHRGNRIEYKVRTSNPDSDFNMYNSQTGASQFIFSDEKELPEWIHHDKNAQMKISAAIASTL